MQLSHGIRRRFSSPAAVSGLWDAVLAQGGFESMMLTSSQRTHLEDTFSLSTDQLLAELVQLTAKFAIPPISNFDIGAAALGASGDVYLGVNLEFPGNSISATVHGEQFLLANAIYRNETGISILAVNAAPCGHCRQFLNELPASGELRVLIADAPGSTLAELLPMSFGPADLGCTTPLFSHFDHGLSHPAAKSDPVVAAAMAAANKCYTPYTASPAGVTLQGQHGHFSGGYIENAAYNPSLPPLQAALVALRTSGITDFTSIERAVLVECADSGVQQGGISRQLLSQIAPDVELECIWADRKQDT